MRGDGAELSGGRENEDEGEDEGEGVASHNVASREEADHVLQELWAAGG